MEERQARADTAQAALDEIDVIRDFFRKEGGISPDEALDEMRNNFGVELNDETELREYLKNLEKSHKDLLTTIKTSKPELITKRETTLLNERIKATEQGLKEGRIQTKEEISKVQTELIEMI